MAEDGQRRISVDECDRLAEYYLEQLKRRYCQLCQRPGKTEAKELLAGADDETLMKVLELLRGRGK